MRLRLLRTLPEHLSSPPVFSGVRVIRSLVLYVWFVDRCLSFFSLAIVLSVLLRYTDSDYLPLVSSNSSYQCMRETDLGFSNCSNNKWAWRGDLNLVREIIISFSNNYITLFRNSNKNVDIKFSARDAFLE